jgi:hypothetical protein
MTINHPVSHHPISASEYGFVYSYIDTILMAATMQFETNRLNYHAFQHPIPDAPRHVAQVLDHPALDAIFAESGADLKRYLSQQHDSVRVAPKTGMSVTPEADGHAIPLAEDWVAYLDRDSLDSEAQNACHKALAEMTIAHMRHAIQKMVETPAMLEKVTGPFGWKFLIKTCTEFLVEAHNTQTMEPHRIPGGLSGALCSKTTGEWWVPSLKDGQLNFTQWAADLAQDIRAIEPAAVPRP